jgi:hypothetical protein
VEEHLPSPGINTQLCAPKTNKQTTKTKQQQTFNIPNLPNIVI